MVLGEKFLFDLFAGKDTRYHLEDKERMHAARALEMPRRQLEMMAPGAMQRRALPSTAYPFQGGMIQPQYQEVICPCGQIRKPWAHQPGCDYEARHRHPRYPREWGRLPPPFERRRRPRGRREYDPDDYEYDGYHGDDHEFDGSVVSRDDELDRDERDYELASLGGFSYDRPRPRHPRGFGGHPGRHHHGLGGYGGDARPRRGPHGYGGNAFGAYGPSGYHNHPEDMSGYTPSNDSTW